MQEQTVHCFFDMLVYASSSFLHLPIIALIGFIGYLAYRGFILSNQIDYIRGLEFTVNELKAQAERDNEQLDTLTLERANLKDAIKDKERIARESSKIMDNLVLDHQASKKTVESLTEEFNLEEAKASDALWELERAQRENSRLEDELADLTNKCETLELEVAACNDIIKEHALDEERFRELIESTIVDHIQRGDLAHTIAQELSSEFEITLVEC